MKRCISCQKEKSMEEFSLHSAMKDGRINKCKECCAAYSREHRKRNLEAYRAYDKARGNRQGREYLQQYRRENPEKYKAACLVNNYIRDGKLVRQPCEVCGGEKNVHAHHDDYRKPLEVRWLCAAHHRQWHVMQH